MKRRILSILTALALVLGLLPGEALAAGTPLTVKIGDVTLVEGGTYASGSVGSSDTSGFQPTDGMTEEAIAAAACIATYRGGTLTIEVQNAGIHIWNIPQLSLSGDGEFKLTMDSPVQGHGLTVSSDVSFTGDSKLRVGDGIEMSISSGNIADLQGRIISEARIS